MIPGTISLEITYSRSRQNPILKISNFPAISGKVRYPNEKVPSDIGGYSLGCITFSQVWVEICAQAVSYPGVHHEHILKFVGQNIDI